MAEERQSQNPQQPQGQHQQPRGQQASGQSSQEMQRRSGSQQTGMARRGGGQPSLFNLDPSDFFRTSPFALMRRLSEEMDNWFEQFSTGRGRQGMATAGGQLFAPPVEVCERDGKLIICVDLPGMSKDDVRVEVTDDMLLIEGERRSQHEEQQGESFHSERRYGMFRRQIPLPEGINAEQASANFKDGVLEITMPAPQRQERGRRIEIQSAAGSSAEQPQAQAASAGRG